ncbi:MAG TPA: AAA-like domain-containing protein, partial [Cyanophyceae cyanobacterium]
MNDIEEIIKITENLVLSQTGYSLSFIQKVLLKESILEVKKTYTQIARENNYSENYIKQGVAPKLWQLLSDTFGEKVNRTNCRAVLEQRLKNARPSSTQPLTNVSNKIALEFPEGQVPLNSPFYIERDFSEKISYQEVTRPGSLIRIQAPKKMGKTSLLIRILDYAQKQNYHTIHLSLYQAETEIFTSLQRFLRWICANVAQQLELESSLNRYWDEDVGALVSCAIYFQNYILQEISNPIILAFDEINRILEYPNIARDFLSLLRSWHERSKDTSDWQRVRMII